MVFFPTFVLYIFGLEQKEATKVFYAGQQHKQNEIFEMKTFAAMSTEMEKDYVIII